MMLSWDVNNGVRPIRISFLQLTCKLTVINCAGLVKFRHNRNNVISETVCEQLSYWLEMTKTRG